MRPDDHPLLTVRSAKGCLVERMYEHMSTEIVDFRDRPPEGWLPAHNHVRHTPNTPTRGKWFSRILGTRG